MAVNKGYKQSEIGLIPEDWDIQCLGDLAEICMCRRILAEQTHESGDVPFFKIGTFGGTPDAFIPYRLYEEYRKNYSFPHKGDVLISAAGTLGRAIVYDGQDAYFQDSNIVWLDVNKRLICNEFLYYCYQRIQWAPSEGSTISRLYNGIIRATRILLPSTIAEQEAIAGALSDADAWIESLEQLIAKKRQIKQGAMQELLTGKRRLPGFSGEWISRMLPDVSHFRGGKAHEQYIRDNAKYVCVNSKFISTEGKVRKYTTENFCSARADDILMVMSDLPNGKALAKTFIVDKDNLYAVNQRVCALTPRENYCSQFLAFVLDRNAYFLRFDDGVNQTHLLNRVFEKCPLVVPATKAEQTAIATILSDMDAEIKSLEQTLAKAREIKQGMMQELLTGRIRLV